MKFSEWMEHRKKLSSSSISKYNHALKVTLTNMSNNSEITSGNILEIVTKDEFERIKNEIMLLPEFIDLNKRGNNMYSAALNKYSLFMEDTYLVKEIEKEIDIDEEVSETTKLAIVEARKGQGLFRQKLIYKWKGCSVTGVDDFALLIASHIKPWKDANNFERLDSENGLLLVPNLDKCFDKGYLSFENSGKILLWNAKIDVFERMGLDKDMMLRESGGDLSNYLNYHRENVYYG